MRYAQAHQGVLNAKRILAPITQGDSITCDAPSRLISWDNYKSGIMKGRYYPLEYQRLIDLHQYSILMTDGSFFQFFYQFNEIDVLQRARLAYYPRPINTVDSSDDLMLEAEQALDREDEFLYEHLFNWIELLEQGMSIPTNTSHIRFDYDKFVTSHAPAHLQFGGVQNFRLPANFCPLPLAFVQMCQALIEKINPIDSATLGFERNNVMKLADQLELIRLAAE